MADPPDWDPMLPEKGRLAALRATHQQAEEALKHATQFLDTLPFKGMRLTETQSLAWPRVGVVGKDGLPVRGVPPEIVEATHLVASFILAKIPFGPPALAHVFLLVGHLIEEKASLIDRGVTWH